MKKIIVENKKVIIIIVLSILAIGFTQNFLIKEYSTVESRNIHYSNGVVEEIKEESIEYNEALQIYLGKQKLSVKLKNGNHKGENVQVENFLTVQHNIKANKGTKVIVAEDEPEGISPYYTIYNYDRQIGMTLFVVLLFVIIILIGKTKGIKSIIGLVYTLLLVVYLLLPLIFSGYSPLLVSLIVVILSTAVTLLLLNGESIKTENAIMATILGVLISVVFFLLMSKVLNLSGFSTPEVENLQLINSATGLQIKDILFAGILIASLGAIMDVAMSIVSSLHEIQVHNENISFEELFHSGMEIGKDMIGTMTNTLILAFTGTAFMTLLVLFSFNIQTIQLLNSDFLILEIAQGIVGTLGIVVTVPIASFICAKRLIK